MDEDEVLVRGLDASSVWCRELRLRFEDYGAFGYGPLSGLAAEECVAMCSVVGAHVRVIDEDGTLRLQLLPPPAVAAAPPAEALEPTIEQTASSTYLDQLYRQASTSEPEVLPAEPEAPEPRAAPAPAVVAESYGR